MPPLFAGDRPPRLRIDRERITVGGGGLRTEVITIMNDGGGVLKGTALSDVRWITFPSPRVETPFILPFRIEIHPDRIAGGPPATGTVTLVTNGGAVRIGVEFITHPLPHPRLSLDDRHLRFCNLKKGEDITTDLTLRNTGSGILSGTVESESDWIDVKTRTIWTKDIQVIPIVIHTRAAPAVRQPVGKIRVRSSGGEQDITINIHFRTGDGPRLRLDPPRIRCTWDKRGTIESTVTVINEGEGILRGTISSPVPWMRFIPSIFPVETRARIILKVDTRTLPADGTLSIPVPVITNAGRTTLNVEVTAGKTVPAPPRKIRPSRTLIRTRLVAYLPDGGTCLLLSTGRAGGEGEIYHVSGDQTRCAKIFHPHRRTAELEEKLRVMVDHPLPPGLLTSVTWPLLLLTDLPKGGHIIGYLMRRIPDEEFRPAHLWYDEAGERDAGGLKARYSLASRLAAVVEGIHQSNHAIGDLRENNLLIGRDGSLILIDTDSFQIHAPATGRIFWSRVGTGEYLPPEHLDGSFSRDGCDRRCGDHFALAVLIFRFLMDGVHPFQAKGPLVRDAPATTDKILLGHFAFESRLAGIAPPDYAPPYDSVPPAVQELFRQAFVTGHRQPSARPDATRWGKAFRALLPTRPLMHPGPDTGPAAPEPVGGSEQKSDRNRLMDRGGLTIMAGERLFCTAWGSIHSSDQRRSHLYLPVSPLPIGMREYRVADPPASLVIPSGTVTKGGVGAGWIIPAIDPGRYRPWHLIADPQSRWREGWESFSFRHRIACCRNLMAAVLSASRLGISDLLITDRSVFVGSDASVRILCLPGIREDQPGDEKPVQAAAILIFKMLMDGYHPFHATGPGIRGYRSPERRMAAGLFPWTGDTPRLRPPPRAPSWRIIPDGIRDFFRPLLCPDTSHPAGDGKPDDPLTWFSALDRIFSTLIRCQASPDHWFVPGKDGCPWCRSHHPVRRWRQNRRTLCLPAPGPEPFRLTAGWISGYLMLPSRFRRPVRVTASRTCWDTIPLPAAGSSRSLLPVRREHPALTTGRSIPALLIVREHFPLVCIPYRPRPPAIRQPVRVPGSGGVSVPEPSLLPPASLRFIDACSLIDEMIWVSTMDRLRGEGVAFRGRRQARRPGPVRVLKRPVQIMIPRLYIPWPEDEEPVPPPEGTKKRGGRKRTRGKGGEKGIRSRLQSILRDFLDAPPTDP